MADEIQMTARLYASKNGAYLPSVTYTKSATMVGTDMGSPVVLFRKESE